MICLTLSNKHLHSDKCCMKMFLATLVRINKNINTTQVSWTSWMDKWCAIHPYNWILFRIKIITTSFKSFRACAATLNTLNLAACHHRPTPLPVTLGHSQPNLCQSLVGSLLLSSGSWCTQGSVCALQESVSQSCVSSAGSMVGLMVTSSKRAYA